MNQKNTVTAILLLISTVCACAKNYAPLYANLPFKMELIPPPDIPSKEVSIVRYGAIGNGVTLNTNAINQAISELSSAGGGRVVIPAGVWLSGPIVLQSNIDLHLAKGALLVFTADFDKYPLVSTVFEGLQGYRCQSPISGRGLTNISITGEGVINGSGSAWRPLKRTKVTDGYWKNLVNSSGHVKNKNIWFPTLESLRGDSLTAIKKNNELTIEECIDIKDFLRPVMISLIECKNILLSGVLFENSPSWNIHPLMCENVIIDGIEVRNPSYAQNGDGLDLESCKNAIIVNSTFDVGDDAICIKSGKDEDGRRRGIPTENVIVNNCRVYKAHGGFVVGSEMSGGVRNISVSDCQFIGTNIGLRFKSARGRGGVVEHIYIENINMLDIVHEPLSFNLYYFTAKSDMIPPVDETTPCFKDIFIKNVTCRNARKAMLFHGIPEMKIQNVQLENVAIRADEGAEIREASQVGFKNVALIIKDGPAVILENVDDFNSDRPIAAHN